jgi:hypothetical protein
MSPYVYIVAAGLIFASGVGVGVKWEKGQQAVRDTQAREQADEVRRQQLRGVDTAAEGHENDKAAIQTVFRTITKEVEHVVEKPVYRNVCIDPDGLRVANRAIAGAAAASGPAPALRGSSATR